MIGGSSSCPGAEHVRACEAGVGQTAESLTTLLNNLWNRLKFKMQKDIHSHRMHWVYLG
jgi:hypothetical protein